MFRGAISATLGGVMDRKWIRERNFSSLSITDLLEAREAYHVHLAHLDNVFATAVGRYLIRNADADAKDSDKTTKGSDEPRTLANSSVKKWSWPCILVFVEKWQKPAETAARPETMVPPFLYLPDGRVIPTCVVFADRQPRPPVGLVAPVFSSDLIGGGYPALQEVQGARRLSTLGCLVTDGDQVYMLTNRHVTGEAGREVATVIADRSQRIGVSAGRDLGKKPFGEVYPGWPGARVLLNLDAGLIRLDDVSRCTAQVFGVGELGPVWDLHTDAFDLDMIECPVRAHGAAGGDLRGQIQALFFRYKTMGGIEYVSDFLIGPRGGRNTVGTRAGDSGAIWFVDKEAPAAGGKAATLAPVLRPFAMQWGGQTLAAPGADLSADFALATGLSTICRELDVEIITDWNAGQPETWGPVGHFKVGALACDLVKDQWLHGLFTLNLPNIGYDDGHIENAKKPHPKTRFVPLADVADFVWRTLRGLDDNNHFADIDRKARIDTQKHPELKDIDNRSLLQLTKNKPEHVHPDFWNRFYGAMGENKRGALPFRVWQIYDEMVGFAAAGKIDDFVCAAGLMAHYVGDACQPLHVSELHHGSSESESGVHSAYETAMLNAKTGEMIAAVAEARATWPEVPVKAGNGHDAAVAVVELMRRTVKRLPPAEVIEVFNDNPGRGRSDAMWAAVGKRTAAGLFDGALTLARLWEGAWKRGRGNAADPALPAAACAQDVLMALYLEKTFLQSYKLQDLREQNGKLVAV